LFYACIPPDVDGRDLNRMSQCNGRHPASQRYGGNTVSFAAPSAALTLASICFRLALELDRPKWAPGFKQLRPAQARPGRGHNHRPGTHRSAEMGGPQAVPGFAMRVRFTAKPQSSFRPYCSSHREFLHTFAPGYSFPPLASKRCITQAIP
jgi:hypothetical protein